MRPLGLEELGAHDAAQLRDARLQAEGEGGAGAAGEGCGAPGPEGGEVGLVEEHAEDAGDVDADAGVDGEEEDEGYYHAGTGEPGSRVRGWDCLCEIDVWSLHDDCGSRDPGSAHEPCYYYQTSYGGCGRG